MIFDAPETIGSPLAPSGAQRVAIATLHGFLGQASSFDAVLREAAAGVCATVARGRLPGHGVSPWSASGLSFDDVADAIARALPFDEPCILVAYSMGARVALDVALRHPTRVRRAVLIGVHPGLEDAGERAARVAWDDAQADRLELDGLERFAEAWESLPVLATQRRLPEAVRTSRRRERLLHRAPDVAGALRTLGLGRMPPLAGALVAGAARGQDKRFVLVTGALDDKFTAIARELASRCPRIEHRIVPDAGHDVALEAPRALAAIVREAAVLWQT